MPVFGFGARTFPGSSTTTNIFPMSMNMSNPLIPNEEEILVEQYAKCLSLIKMDLPVKLSPIMLFLKNMAASLKDKQEKKVMAGLSAIRFPQVFYQVFVLLTGVIHDIEELLKVFECSQWACLPIQINFVNVYLKNMRESDLDSLKLRDSVQKYNEEVAGWNQLKIKFIKRNRIPSQISRLGEEFSNSILRNVEDYLFVNQMVTKEELKKMSLIRGDSKDLVQEGHQNLLDMMETKHQKLFELAKKKIGIDRQVFNKIIESGDIREWSIEACLHAAQKHDSQVIQEALSADEQTVLAQSHVSNTLAQSMLNKSISVGATHSGPTKNNNIEETKSEGYNSEEEELKQMSKSTIWT